MDHMDEKFIESMNEVEKEAEEKKRIEKLKRDFKNGFVVIDDETIEFEERSLLQDKIKICLPKNFEIMSHEVAALKYPSERRPSLIFTDESTSINIAFNHTQNAINEAEVAKFKDNMIEILKKMQPSIRWFENGVKNINNKRVGFYEMLAPGFDGNSYNFVFFTELEGKVLLCSLNCLEEEMEDWKPVAREIMETLKIC